MARHADGSIIVFRDGSRRTYCERFTWVRDAFRRDTDQVELHTPMYTLQDGAYLPDISQVDHVEVVFRQDLRAILPRMID